MATQEMKPTKAMLSLLKDMASGCTLQRRDCVRGYQLFHQAGMRTLAYPMPYKMEDMGLIAFTRDNEEAKYSKETGALTSKGRQLIGAPEIAPVHAADAALSASC